MKKVIKNTLLIILVASMLFLLVGCGGKDITTTNEAEKNESKDITTTNEEEKNESKEFSMGEWKNNVYTNDFLGLKFNLPEGWSYSSDEEIAKMMDLGVDLLNDEQKMESEVAKLTSVYYMVANDPNTGNSVVLLSEKPLIDLTVDSYLNQLKNQLTSVDSINYEMGEEGKETIANKEFATLTATATMNNVKMIQKYYVYKLDKYFVSIIATSTTQDTGINEIIRNFE